MEFLLQIINGLQIGSIYALVALGYTMVYGIVKLINFAHGDIIMVGAYASFYAVPVLSDLGLPLWLCIVPASLVCAAVGLVSERVAYRPLRGSPRISSLITAIGVSLLLQNLCMLLFSPNAKAFPTVIDLPSIALGNFQLSGVTILTISVSVLLMVGLQTFVKKTKIGCAMRAVSEDTGAAKLVGINVNQTISITFAIGSILAAVAALLYASSYPSIRPMMGSMLGIKAFTAAVLGGIGNIPGAMIGGIIIGVAESFTKAYISSTLSDAVVFGILIVVLLVKPTGIFGKNVGEKV